MKNLETNFAFVHQIADILIGPIDQDLAQHTRGSSGQQGLKALLAQTTLFTDSSAAELFHVLAILALATVVSRARLTLMTPDTSAAFNVRTRYVLRTQPLFYGAFSARQITHHVFARLCLTGFCQATFACLVDRVGAVVVETGVEGEEL